MKLKGDFLKHIKAGDIAAVVLIAFICVLWFLPAGQDTALRADIYLDGTVEHTVYLDEVEAEYTLMVGSCEILIEKDAVSFISSECSDSLCISRGRMTKSGDTMACVPERVVVVLYGERSDGFDSVVY